MNCIDCRYSLLKDGHSNCTYEEGECIKISVLETENAELKEDLRNKKLAIQNRNGRIKELEAQIEKMKCCYNCSKWNEGLLLCNDSTVRVTTYADYCCEDWEIKENDQKD